MILTRSPLRISLGGGGTDLPSYSNEFGGYLIAAAINKYVFVTVSRPFEQEILLKYSAIERVHQITDVKHPIIREVLQTLNLRTPQIEISSIADLPSGTGLGSSGSFTTALIKALYTHYRLNIHPKELAELACEIEINKLREPIGKQDQYISAYGGITEFTFKEDGSVVAESLPLPIQTVHDLEDNLVLYFTGISRSASGILIDQNSKSLKNDQLMLENLHFTKELGRKSKEALITGNTSTFGTLLNEHWQYKRLRSIGISNTFIDQAYDCALKSGAIGGKLVGAGGGGFLMFYANNKEKLRMAMTELGLEEVRFKFDFEGTKVILS